MGLKLYYEYLLSILLSFAFKCNLRHYSWGADVTFIFDSIAGTVTIAATITFQSEYFDAVIKAGRSQLHITRRVALHVLTLVSRRPFRSLIHTNSADGLCVIWPKQE